jgi:PIG-X / PBN1
MALHALVLAVLALTCASLVRASPSPSASSRGWARAATALLESKLGSKNTKENPSRCLPSQLRAARRLSGGDGAGSGFHLSLDTRVEVPHFPLRELCPVSTDKSNEKETFSLEIVSVDVLPRGAYVDADEVSEQERLQQFPTGIGASVTISGSRKEEEFHSERAPHFGAETAFYMDVEAPAYAASVASLDPASRVVATGAVLLVPRDAVTVNLAVNMSLPVHARYGAPGSRNSRSAVPLSASPEGWLVRCGGAGAWKELCGVVREGESLVDWSIPVGELEHKQFVTWGTTAVALGATAFLVREFLR